MKKSELVRPCRVLLISHAADLTGAPKSVLMLALRLNWEKFQPDVLVPGRGPLLERLPVDVVAHVVARESVPFTGIKALIKAGPPGWVRFGWGRIRYISRVYGLIKRGGYDLLHINSSVQGFVGIAAWLSRKPVVWHIQEQFGTTLKARLLARFIALVSDRIVLASEATRRAFLNVAGSKTARKCRVVYSGIEQATFKPQRDRETVRAEWGVSPGTVVIALLGTIAPRKGQKVLLEAVRRLIHQQPELSVAVVLAGPAADPEYGRECLALSEEPDLKSSVRWLGERGDAPDLLNAADIVVTPSLRDPFPWVVLEAMLLAKPVVASRVDGIVEMVVEGDTGLLVEPGKSSALAKALLRLIKDPPTRQAMGEHGQIRVLSEFSEEKCVQGFEQVYLSCAADNPSSGKSLPNKSGAKS